MEARVAILEEGFKRIELKLDKLVESVAEMKGQLSAMPTAETFGEIQHALGKLEGRVDSLPTIPRWRDSLRLPSAFSPYWLNGRTS